MKHSMSDAGIPLLTEVIAPAAPLSPIRQPEGHESLVPGRESAATDAPSPPVDVEAFGVSASPVLDEKPGELIAPPDWDKLEREIRERITARLREKIDTVVEQRMEETLADLLQIAVESITSEIRQSLHQAISDTVSQAVAAEISLLKQSK